MTKIFFERSGGFMGRTVNFEVDLDDLPKDMANTWYDLLDEADFFDLPENLTGKNIPDGFTYHIKVEGKKGEHSVRCGDTSVPDDLRPLLDELSKQARMQR